MHCCIIIPVYKRLDELASDEINGFEQACRLFSHRNIYLIHPNCLQIEPYLDCARQYHEKASSIAVDDRYFSKDRSGYSRMLTSLWFYQLFQDFDFMLIHQLDAFVFRDELDEWMQKGYDYIGAPMLYEACSNLEELEQKALVGNGGLSLRKTKTFISLLKQNPVIRSAKSLMNQYKHDYKGKSLRMLLRFMILPFMAMGFRNRMRYFAKQYNVHEDYFWCHHVASSMRHFKIAPVQEAARFSLDGFPKMIANMLNIYCPMGCHAWKRFDEEFWVPFINKAVSKAIIENGQLKERP